MQYLKIIHWNCFKMTQSRLIELTNFLSETKPDIMCLNEVKYSHEEANLFLRFDSYYVYYKPRIKNPSDGGGVAILVRDVIPHTRIMSGLADNLENVGIRVENGSNFLNLIALYSPARTLSFEAIKGYLDLGSELLLLGDLNANSAAIGCKRQDYNGNVLDQILDELDLVVINDDSTPTYFQFKSDHTEILDLILSSASVACNVNNLEVLTDQVMDSDHAPVLCYVKLDGPSHNKTRTSKARFNFNKANWNLFREIVDEKVREFPIHESLNNPEALCGYLISAIQDASDKAIPKFINISAKSYPDYILNLIKERRLVRKKWIRNIILTKKPYLE